MYYSVDIIELKDEPMGLFDSPVETKFLNRKIGYKNDHKPYGSDPLFRDFN